MTKLLILVRHPSGGVCDYSPTTHVRNVVGGLLLGLLSASCSQSLPPESLYDEIRAAAETIRNAPATWPGFDLGGEIVIASILPDGPVYLVGDPTPPPAFQVIDEAVGLASLVGFSNPQYQGLQVAMNWEGTRRGATAVPIDPALSREKIASALAHEIFHTFQRRRNAAEPTEFVAKGDACFPLHSARAVGLLNMEGMLLWKGLEAVAEDSLNLYATAALAVRRSRCKELGAIECARQRAIEQLEGTASFVEVRSTNHLAMIVGDWKAGLRGSLSPVEDPAELTRGHFYSTGLAWIILLERMNVPNWHQKVAGTAPDEVLGNAVSLSDAEWEELSVYWLTTPDWKRIHTDASSSIERWSKGMAPPIHC